MFKKNTESEDREMLSYIGLDQPAAATQLDFYFSWRAFFRSGTVFWARSRWYGGTERGVNSAATAVDKRRESEPSSRLRGSSLAAGQDSPPSVRRVWMWALRARLMERIREIWLSVAFISTSNLEISFSRHFWGISKKMKVRRRWKVEEGIKLHTRCS